MRKTTKSFLWVIVIGSVIAGGLIFYFNLKKAVKLENVTVDATSISQDTVEMEINMLINNPFFFDFFIKDLQYKAALGDEQLLDDSTAIDKEIDDSTRLQIPIAMNYEKVLAQLEELQAQDSTWLDFSFDVRYSLPLLGLQKTSVDRTLKIPVPVLVDIKMDEVAVNSFGFKNIDLDIKMLLDNPSKLEATMDNLVFDVRLNESTLVKGMHWNTVEIDPEQTSYFTIPVKVKTGALAKEFFDKITEGEEINVYLDGSCILKLEDTPVDSIRIQFETEGAMEL